MPSNIDDYKDIMLLWHLRRNKLSLKVDDFEDLQLKPTENGEV